MLSQRFLLLLDVNNVVFIAGLAVNSQTFVSINSCMFLNLKRMNWIHI